jgi:hypothetical protein
VASQPGDGRNEAQYRFVAVASVNGMLLKSVSRVNRTLILLPGCGCFASQCHTVCSS